LFDDRFTRQRGAEATARFASGTESGEEGIGGDIDVASALCADSFEPRFRCKFVGFVILVFTITALLLKNILDIRHQIK